MLVVEIKNHKREVAFNRSNFPQGSHFVIYGELFIIIKWREGHTYKADCFRYCFSDSVEFKEEYSTNLYYQVVEDSVKIEYKLK